MLFSNFERFFGIVAEILHIMTFRAGHAQLTGYRDHLVANFIFLRHKLSHGLGMSLRN